MELLSYVCYTAGEMPTQVKDQLIMVRMSSTLRNRAIRAAAGRGQTLSEWVRALIAEATSGPILPSKRRQRRK